VGELVGQQARARAAGGGGPEGDVDQGRSGWGADTHRLQLLWVQRDLCWGRAEPGVAGDRSRLQQ
jgi:hypothetical protein